MFEYEGIIGLVTGLTHRMKALLDISHVPTTHILVLMEGVGIHFLTADMSGVLLCVLVILTLLGTFPLIIILIEI